MQDGNGDDADVPANAKLALDEISKIIGGDVFVKSNDTFWIKKTDGSEVPFTLGAEGFRKLGFVAAAEK